MNREIKFRGKRTDTGKWVYGNLLQDSGLCFIVKNIQELTEKPFNECLVIPDTVGQYTGKKDRNGKDVWEGDLLRTPEGDIMVAEWIDAKIITRCVRPYNPRYKNSLTFAYPVSVVVGNIYDNPELLEGGK